MVFLALGRNHDGVGVVERGEVGSFFGIEPFGADFPAHRLVDHADEFFAHDGVLVVAPQVD